MTLTHDIVIILDKLECARLLAIAAGNSALAKAIQNLMTVAQAAHDENVGHSLLDDTQSLAVDMCDNQNLTRMGDVQSLAAQLQALL